MAWLRNPCWIVVLVVAAVQTLGASIQTVPAERIKLIKEIQERLNISFKCVDRAFLESADRGRIFFAIAHEYAHAYLQHDVLLYEHLSKPIGQVPQKNLPEIRRRLEKEADGIAARKAKEMGFPIESILEFILTQPDAEKGFHPDLRAYCKPRERADYIFAVYQSS